ncbi:MAG TPA: N-methyl-L-tryptophan oxidase [Acidimicrobiales bacterium]|nr:N-methyl-L-tryptophan oxidase [Acidimicrobiales bacterium]
MTGSPDVIVVGLGGMGAAATYHLARRGLAVLGLEQFGPAHDRGSSHGGSRVVRQAYFEDPSYVPLARRAYDLWAELEAAWGTPLMQLTGAVMVGSDASEVVAGTRRSAEEWGLAHEVLSADEVGRRVPTLAPGADAVAVWEPAGGFVRPEEAVRAHLGLAERHGARLAFGETVTGWRSDRSGVRVDTTAGRHDAGRLVVCPGAWAPWLLGGLNINLVVERQVQYWLSPERGIEAFLPDRHPVFFWEDEAGGQLYGFPAHEGPRGGVKVAFYHGGAACTPGSVDRTVHQHEVDALTAFLRPRIPALGGTLLRTAVCMYTNTPDRHFVVGPHPGAPRVTVACGFSGHGFKFVPVIGEVIADLVIEEATPHPLAAFDPGRALPPP